MNGRRPRARCKESQADSLLNPRSAAHRILSEVRRGGFADESAEAILPEVAQIGVWLSRSDTGVSALGPASTHGSRRFQIDRYDELMLIC